MLKVLLLLLVMAGVACAPASQPAPAASEGDQPHSGGQLNVTLESDPFDWDVTYLGKSNPNIYGLALSYNSLLHFKSGPGVDYTEAVLEPELAERWSMSPDARTFTFNIRKGVKYAPSTGSGNVDGLNGREFTAADVKWTLEYRTRSGEFKDKNLPPAQVDFLFEGMDRVETPDPYTVVVRFKDPFAPFMNYAASRWNPMLPKEVYQQDGHLKDKVVGTGPYILDMAATQKGTRWVWKKNPAYWEGGKPYIDEIRWLILPAESAQYAAFQTKQLDILDSLAYTNFQDVKKATPNVGEQKSYATNAQALILSQTRGGPLTDVRVRRAISMSLDRDAISQAVAGGQALWAVPGATANTYSPEETRRLVRQDVDEAKRLLAEAGFVSGTELEWPIPRDESTANVSMFQLVQAQVRRAGINFALKPLDLSDQRARRRRGDFDLDASIGGTGILNSDIDSLVYGRYHTGAAGNYGRAADSELDKLLEASRQETDPAKRKDVLGKVSMRLLDQLWTVDTIYVPRWDVWQPYVRNYRPHFTDIPVYRFAWVDK
jgi:peptide/nickel transport system substrate-binding protein